MLTCSVIIPNLNGGGVLAGCLESLAAQHDPALEVILVDGASTDDSMAVAANFPDLITHQVSEPDAGQADALNKGLALATGAICTWLCSDDRLEPGALRRVRACFETHPGVDLVAGTCHHVYPEDPKRDCTLAPPADAWAMLPIHNGLWQPSCFWRASSLTRTPPLDVTYHFAMDNELWCWFKSQGARLKIIDAVLSTFVWSATNKTTTGGRRIGLELDRLYRTYSSDRVPLSFWYRQLRYPFECALGRDRGPLRLALLRCVQGLWMLCFAPFYGLRAVTRMSWPA